MMMPGPKARETIKVFLSEACKMHIDGVDFRPLSSGIACTVHYRDLGGHSHKKTMSAPEARNMSDIEDMIILVSEWLNHGTTKQLDMLKVAGNA